MAIRMRRKGDASIGGEDAFGDTGGHRASNPRSGEGEKDNMGVLEEGQEDVEVVKGQPQPEGKMESEGQPDTAAAPPSPPSVAMAAASMRLASRHPHRRRRTRAAVVTSE